MANKRMFSKEIVGSDAFMDMPVSSQLLYFHLGMEADDDGFIGNPKKVSRSLGASDDDIKVLLSKKFVIIFESGVLVIKHHRMNNNWDKYNCKRTVYLEEFDQLFIKENKAYTLDKTQGIPIQTENRLKTVFRIEENRIDKNRIEREHGDKSPTPSQEAKMFFEGGFEPILHEFIQKSKIGEQILRNEFAKFILYWTEKNKSGTKQRWEQQSTFEVKRRLATWLGMVKDFTSKENKSRIIV